MTCVYDMDMKTIKFSPVPNPRYTRFNITVFQMCTDHDDLKDRRCYYYLYDENVK